MTSIKWAEHTAPEIALAAQQNALVILPLGCTEQHAAHLPVDTDTYQVERLTLEGARKAARAQRDVTLRVLSADEGWRALKDKYFPNTDGGHAAVMETALCLAERPHLAHIDRIRSPQLRMVWERYSQGEAFLFREVTDTGALGDASPATAEGGRALWNELSDAFAETLHALDEQDRRLQRR